MAGPQPAEKQATFFLYQSARNARQLSLLLFLVSLLTVPVIYWLAANQGASLIALAPLALAAVLTLVSFRLANSNRPYQAAYVLIGANLLMGAVLVSILSGLGLIWAFNSFLISILLALRILPRPQLARTVFVAATITIGILALDTFAPWPRPELILMGQWLIMVLGAGLLGLLLFWEAPEFPNYSLRAKFVIGNIIVVIVTVAGLTLFINWSTGATLTNTVGNNLNSVAETQARALGELLSRQIGVLQGLGLNQGLQVDLVAFNEQRETLTPDQNEAGLRQTEAAWMAAAFNDPLVQARLNNAIARELLEFRSRFPAHSEVLVTDRYGGLIAATNRTSRYYFAEEPWWQAAFDSGRGSIFISPPNYDAGRDTFSVRIAIPVYGSNSRNAAGVLASTYSLRELEALLVTAGEEMGETSQLNLLLPSGEIVSFQEPAVQTIEAGLLAELQAIPSRGYDTFEFNGVPSVVSRASVNTLLNVPEIDALSWQVVIHEAREASQTPVREQRRNVILFGLIGLVISSVIADLVGRSLTRPIIRLRDTAGEVAAGNLSARAQIESHDEIGALATTFNAMTTELQQTLLDQERKIADRTRALEVSHQVSRRLSTILDERQLVAEVVRQVQQAFDYYHVHIYLLDKTGEKLVMAGGTGEAGRVLLAAGHSLTKDRGLIGQAFESNQVVLEPDVKESAAWVPNPLLPYTRSEIAVPIASGNQVLGILDVQHNIQNGLGQEDADLLQAVANQVAIALRNARSYEAARRQAERESKINAINQRIQSTTSVENAMQVAVRELGQALSAGSIVFKLTDDGRRPGNGRLEPDATLESWQPPDGRAGDAGPNGQVLARDIEIRGETIARLEVGTQSLPDPEAQALLDVVAERLGGHIESLRLTEQTQRALAETARRAEEQAAINNLAQAVSQHLDQDQLLETVYQEVRRLMSTDAFIVALYEPQAEMIHYPLVYDGDERFEQEPTPLSPQGTTSRVIRDGEPVLIVRSQEEIERIAGEVGHTLLGDTQRISASLLYVPLRTADRTFGVLSVQSYRLNAFTDSDVTLLSGIANHVAVALENADLFEQTQATLDETELLYNLSARINSATSLGDLVRVVDSPGVAPGARSAELFILEGQVDGQNQWLVAAANWALDGTTAVPMGSRIHLPSLSTGLAGMYRPDEPLLISEVAADDRLDDFSRLTFEQFSTAAAAIIPLRQGDEWVGTLIIRWRKPFVFTERQERLYRTLARQMTTALSNRLLLRQTRERAAFLERLSHIESALSQAGSEEEILSTLALHSDEVTTITLHYLEETSDNRPQHAYTVARWEAGSVQPGDQQSLEPFSVADDAGIRLGLANPNEVTFVSDIEPGDQTGHSAANGIGDAGFAAAIIMPLQSAARWQGFITVKWSEPHSFSAEERFIWQQLREPLSAVVASRRAYRAQVAALEETAVLYQASAQLSVAQSYDDILNVLREHTVLGRQSSNLSILLFDQPWEGNQPSWVDVLAFWSSAPTPAGRVKSRFHVRDFPSIAGLLDPLEPVIIEDAKNAPGLDRKLRQLLVNGFRARGSLFSPMVVGGQWIGFISAMYPAVTTFDETDIRRVRVVSQQAAVAVQGLRNLELAQQRAAEAQLRSDELAILNDMGQMLTSVLDVDATIDSIYKHTARLMEASNLYVALYDAAADEVDIRIFGSEEEVTDRSVLRRRAGKGVTEYVINSQKPLLIKENVAERLASLGIEAIGRLPMAWLGVPMIIGRRVIGVIAVQSFTTPALYDEHDRELLTAVASQAAIAIENARLFEQAQARARRERILREITARVRGASDVESVMRAAVAEVGQALGRQTFVYLGNSQDQPSPAPVEEEAYE